MEVNYNSWYLNGSQDIYNHAVYFSSNNTVVKDVQFIGNYVYGQYPKGQYGDVCNGVVVTGHATIDGFRVENNTIELDANKIKDNCWGMGFGAGAFQNKYLRKANFSNNTIKNGGTVAFTVAECPGCVIENNLIIQDWTSLYSIVGMAISEDTISQFNDLSDANRVRNNTVWFGPKVVNGATGIRFSKIGTGHFVANNTVTYSSPLKGDGVNCYNYTNPLASYAFIDNNHCHSAATYSWASGYGLLGAWQASALALGFSFDSVSIIGIPQFTAAGTNFMPAAGSPLIGNGNTAHGNAFDMTGKTRAIPPAIGAFEP